MREPTPLTPERRLWERWLWAWHVLFYGLLLWIGWCLRLPEGLADGGGRSFAAGSGLAGLAVWYGVMVLRRPSGRRSPRAMALYLAVALAAWLALYQVHDIFIVVAWLLAAQTFILLPLAWAAPAALLVTALVWQQSAVTYGLEVLTWVLSLAVPGLVSAWQKAMVRRSEERQKLLDELAATRDELAAAEREAGVLEERQRLAREIHDTVAQEFTSIVLHLEAAEAAMNGNGAAPGPAEKPRKHLDQARQAARHGLSEARSLVHALRPELLDGRSLSAALEQLAERWSEDSGVASRVQVTGDEPCLPREVEVSVLRTAQEALANVRKHAEAREVDLTFSQIGDLVVLDVHDDGRGFTPGGMPPGNGNDGGFGLLGMRERAEQLGGRLLVESAPGEGTTLVLELPIP